MKCSWFVAPNIVERFLEVGTNKIYKKRESGGSIPSLASHRIHARRDLPAMFLTSVCLCAFSVIWDWSSVVSRLVEINFLVKQ